MTKTQALSPRLVSIGPADSEVLDVALMARCGIRAVARGSLSAGQTERAARVGQVFSLLDQYRAEDPPPGLVNKIMARIGEDQQRRRFVRQIAERSGSSMSFG